MKGIVITKMIVVAAVILAVIYFLNQQGNLPSLGIPVAKPTTIKNTQQASQEIIDIGSGVEDITSILDDLDKKLG